MKLDGRRESSNVEDRRGMSGGKKAGLGLGGIIIAMAIAYLKKENVKLKLKNYKTKIQNL